MKHGYWIRNSSELSPRRAVELARAAELGGWDAVFVSDAVAEDHHDPFTLLAAMAAVTERVVLGSWVTPLVARDVLAVARCAATVDELSDGRLLLGVGIGNSTEHRAVGVHEVGPGLGARYDASLDVLARLLLGERVTASGPGFEYEDVALNVRPVQQPRPPIVCAASWPHRNPVRRAARWDGVMPQWPGIGEGADPTITEGARESELREIVELYRDVGGSGAIVVPGLQRFGDDYIALCRDLGVTCLLWCDPLSPEQLRDGPTESSTRIH